MSRDNTFTVSHSSYYRFLPENKNTRPRVVIYARKRSRFQLNLRSDICSDSDLLIGDIIDSKNQLESVQLINIYNEKSLIENDNSCTVDRVLLNIESKKYSIIAGDLNAHHS